MSRIIDPDGDVNLIVGKNNVTDLRVSSKALSLASPVFGALFKPHFKEGAEMRASSYHTLSTNTEPFHLLLPEDDPDAMHLLCNTLHYRQTATPPLKQLKQLAILCDKYQCAGAIISHSTLWLQTCLAGARGHGAIEHDALAVSYLLENEWAFSAITRRLLREHIGSYYTLRQGELGNYLPDHLLVHLDDKRRLALRSIAVALEKPIASILGKVGAIGSPRAIQYPKTTTAPLADHDGTKFCLYDSLRLSSYMRELYRLQVYPWPLEATVSLSVILCRLGNYSAGKVTNSFDFGFIDNGGCVAGCACKLDFKGEIFNAIQNANNMLQGFSLSLYRGRAAAGTEDNGGSAKPKRESDDCSDSSTRAQSGL